MSPIQIGLMTGLIMFSVACLIIGIVAWVDSRRYAAKARAYHDNASKMLLDTAVMMSVPRAGDDRV